MCKRIWEGVRDQVSGSFTRNLLGARRLPQGQEQDLPV